MEAGRAYASRVSKLDAPRQISNRCNNDATTPIRIRVVARDNSRLKRYRLDHYLSTGMENSASSSLFSQRAVTVFTLV